MRFFFCFFCFVFFTIKSPSVTERSVSQENAFKKSKNPSAIFCKTIGSNNNSVTVIENNFRFLRLQNFEFKVRVHWPMGKMNPVVTP